MTRREKNFESGAELEEYLKNPTFDTASYPALKFVYASSEDASFSRAPGEITAMISGQSKRVLQIESGKRKGLRIDLDARKRNATIKVAKPDYCSDAAHPYFVLSNSALPESTPQFLIDSARAAFSCSIKRQTQSNYVTGVNHMKKCEALCGRPFACPMTEEDKLCFTSYLLTKGLKSDTIQSYLTHIKFYELSMGVQNPVKGSELNKQLIQGLKNAQRQGSRKSFCIMDENNAINSMASILQKHWHVIVSFVLRNWRP